MKPTLHTQLLTAYWTPLAISLLLVAVFESDMLVPGALEAAKGAEFLLQTCMVLVTMAVIPLALRLFKLKGVRTRLGKDSIPGTYQHWALLRMWLLEIPMVANTLCYYLFMRPGFGYLAIVLLLASVLVYPSQTRINDETEHSNR